MEKWISVKGVSEAEEANSGNRRDMEDIHLALDNFGGVDGQGVFCVFDGHGGKLIVNFLDEHFSSTLEKNLSKVKMPASNCGCMSPNIGLWKNEVEEKLIQTFAEVDQASSKIEVSGSTVACCLVTPKPGKKGKVLFVANVGDTRAVLCTKTGPPLRMTYDHTASDPSEIKRIEDAGGFMLRGRILGILSVARAIGDHTLKKYVISRPHLMNRDLDGTEEFLIIACDGVWDVFSDEEAVNFVKNGLKENTFTEEKAAESLVAAAVDKGSQDNITALVVFL